MSVKSKSGMVENVGQPLKSRLNQLQFKSYFQFRFGGRHLETVINNVGRHRHRRDQVSRGRKCIGGSRMNYVCMFFETEVRPT